MEKEHLCPGGRRAGGQRNDDFFGSAIYAIEKRNGKWIAHNDEYASYISYCPFCGKKLD